MPLTTISLAIVGKNSGIQNDDHTRVITKMLQTKMLHIEVALTMEKVLHV